MAGTTVNRHDLSSDSDIEHDGEAARHVDPLRDTFRKLNTNASPQKRNIQSKDRNKLDRHSEQIDSGILSMKSGSLELKSCDVELGSHFVDKSPVQCSDGYGDYAERDLQMRLGKLCVTDDIEDEGHSSMSLTSLDLESTKSETSSQELQVIEVDLFEQDDDGDTIIHVAIVSLLTETANTLIDLTEETECLNISNFLHQSPLHLAVLTGQVDVIKALIAKGADVTLRDKQGNTPLHVACRNGDRESVQMIIRSFGDNITERIKYFSVKNCEGLTCLHVAAMHKEYIILGHLFAKGADVNIGDAKSGRTLLHCAVERKDIETVTLLLTHPHIDIDRKTFKGETPLILAYWRNYQDILKRLVSKGAYFSYDVVEDSDDESTT